MYPGTRGTWRFDMISSGSVPAPSSVARVRTCRMFRASVTIRGQNSPGTGIASPKKSLSCVLAMRTRDAVGEPDDDRPRDELDRGAHAGRAEHDEDDAGHHRAHEQAVEAVGGDDAGDDDDERARRTADLKTGSAERRNQEPGDDGAVDAGLRRHAR